MNKREFLKEKKWDFINILPQCIIDTRVEQFKVCWWVQCKHSLFDADGLLSHRGKVRVNFWKLVISNITQQHIRTMTLTLNEIQVTVNVKIHLLYSRCIDVNGYKWLIMYIWDILYICFMFLLQFVMWLRDRQSLVCVQWSNKRKNWKTSTWNVAETVADVFLPASLMISAIQYTLVGWFVSELNTSILIPSSMPSQHVPIGAWSTDQARTSGDVNEALGPTSSPSGCYLRVWNSWLEPRTCYCYRCTDPSRSSQQGPLTNTQILFKYYNPNQ